MKKNVLIVAYDGMNKSGVPSVIMQICRGLKDSCDFTIAIFDHSKDQYFFNELKTLGVSLRVLCCPQHKNKLSRKLFNLFKKQRFVYKQFLSIFKEKQFDIVHSFKEADSLPIFKAAKKAGIKQRILHTTVLHKYTHVRDLKTKHHLKKSARLATVKVGGSKLSCELAFQQLPYKVIINCYDDATFKPLPLESDDLEIVHVGYYSPNKNQLFSLGVIDKIKSKYPNAKLHFIGNQNDTTYYESVISKVKQLHLENNVVFHDGNTNQKDVLKLCTASLVPSILEGFCLVLVESQACGIKCFANEKLPNDADAGGTEFLPLDELLWAQKIVEFYEQKNPRLKLDMQKFSREAFKSKIKKLYFEN